MHALVGRIRQEGEKAILTRFSASGTEVTEERGEARAEEAEARMINLVSSAAVERERGRSLSGRHLVSPSHL